MMKKISILLLAIITIASCKKEHSKEYLTFQGKFENNIDSTLSIVAAASGINKTIKINEDGTFKDTIKVKKGEIHGLSTNSGKRGFVYLNNGYNLTLTGDSNDFINSFKYTGEGAETNNFAVAQYIFSQKLGNPREMIALEKDAFNTKVTQVRKSLDSLCNVYKNADTTLTNKITVQYDQMLNYFVNVYDKQHPEFKKRAELMKKVTKGKVSPKFENFENFKGGTTSLDDLKGKYVYIDLWATWCGPCIREIPSLKSLEKEYHGKNIEFVSISTDSDRNSKTWENAHKVWKAMVADKNLGGTQLWAGKDARFQQAYQVTSIPRFILLDPQGIIVDSNAPRPSDPKLKSIFTELGI